MIAGRPVVSTGPIHAHATPPQGYTQEAVFHHTGALVLYEETMPVRVWMKTEGVTVHVNRGHFLGPTVIALIRNHGETISAVEADGGYHTVALPQVTFNAGDVLRLVVFDTGGAEGVVVQVLFTLASTEGPPPPPPVAT